MTTMIFIAWMCLLWSVFLLGVAMVMNRREHLVDSFDVKERVQGRFTGAKNTYWILDNGKEVNQDTPLFLLMPAIFFTPLLAFIWLVM